jgi:hypothetical protein
LLLRQEVPVAQSGKSWPSLVLLVLSWLVASLRHLPGGFTLVENSVQASPYLLSA